MNYSIIIPFYNESANIDSFFKELARYRPMFSDVQFILVDNGSRDETKKLLSQYAYGDDMITLVSVPSNRGYGYGIISGLKKATGTYVGWLHADLQVSLLYMLQAIDIVRKPSDKQALFIKGLRSNRLLIDRLFTAGMSVFETILFHKRLFDIGAIPVLFHRSLLEMWKYPPHDFAIELYAYYIAQKNQCQIIRIPVYMEERRAGSSSWNTGKMSAKVKQSIRIMKASFLIIKNEQKQSRR